MPGGAAATASQTAGPYWHLIDFPDWADTTRHFAGRLPPGERVVLRGRITDGSGALVTDAMVEIWHADPAGHYPDPDGPEDVFQGYGRCRTSEEGEYRFTTLKPGPVPASHQPGANAQQAPHAALSIFARGLLQGLHTRIYFSGDAANDADPVLAAVDPSRRGTLLALPDGDVDGAPAWRLDIQLNGEDETVFLEV